MTERGTERPPLDFVVNTTEPDYAFPTPQGTVTLRPYREGDEERILELFNSVFNDFVRTREQWDWAFRDHPNGIHVWVGELASGRLVSQFCGLPVRTKVGERTVTFAQIVDSMAHPDVRGGLKKRGLFAKTLLAYCYNWGALDKECVQFGLPNPIAYRIGVQTCYYVPMTKIYAHTKDVQPDESLGAPPDEVLVRGGCFRVSVDERLPPDHDALWERVKARHDVICYRDAAFLTWRYLKNPYWKYRVVTVRDEAGVLRGEAILRKRWLDESVLMLAEWLVDTAVEGAEAALHQVCEHVARADGLHQVKCVLNHMAPESRSFEDKGYVLTPTQFRLVTHSYAPDAVTEDRLNHYWYYTMGDFDVV